MPNLNFLSFEINRTILSDGQTGGPTRDVPQNSNRPTVATGGRGHCYHKHNATSLYRVGCSPSYMCFSIWHIYTYTTTVQRSFASFEKAFAFDHFDQQTIANGESTPCDWIIFCVGVCFHHAMLCIERTMVSQDVCSSVCPSHAGILSKQQNISSNILKLFSPSDL